MHMALLQALSILLLASMLVPGPGSADEAPSGYRTELIHIDANGGFTREAMLSATDGTNSPASSGTYSVAAVRSHKKYLMKLEIGTPPVPFSAVADTGSDLIWTKQMKLCDRSASSTFTHMNSCPDGCKSSPAGGMCGTCCDGLCMFKKRYGSGNKAARGFMGNEMLTLSDKTTDNIVSFGCAIDNDDHLLIESADGIVGLNRGPRSLVRQLKVTKFSYCLSNQLEPKLSSHFWFGNDLVLSGTSLQITPLVKIGPTEQITSEMANRYYVEVDRMCISRTCHVFEKDDFKLKSTKGKGVMFVDSGTPHTSLERTVFGVLKKLLAQVLGVESFTREELGVESTPKKKKKESTCFKPAADPPSEPEMVLHFPGVEPRSGAELHLPWANYTDKPEAGVFCLTIRESELEHSVLGNFEQQNIRMLYDLTEENENLSFVQEVDCSTL